MVKQDRAFKVIKILLELLNSLPGCWEDGVNDEEYTLITSYLISKEPNEYGDMVEGREYLFDEEIMKLAEASQTEPIILEW